MIDWLNQNDGATLALLTGVYVIATIILTVVTTRGTSIARRSLEAAERFERARSRPYVTLNLVNEPLGTIQLVIQNVGVSAAYDVQISTSPEIMILEGGKNVFPSEESEKRHPFIEKGVSFIPPSVKHMNVIALAYSRFLSKYPTERFEGQITYFDVNRNKYVDPIVLDLSTLQGLTYITAYDAGEELHKLSEIIKKK